MVTARAWVCPGLNLGKLARVLLLAATRLPFCQEMTGFDPESRELVQAVVQARGGPGLPFPSRLRGASRRGYQRQGEGTVEHRERLPQREAAGPRSSRLGMPAVIKSRFRIFTRRAAL